MTTRTRKPTTPEVVLHAAPLAKCTLKPRGAAGCVQIGEDFYSLRYIDDGSDILGYTITKVSGPGAGEPYDVPHDLSSCECKGHLRWGRCKHLIALTCVRATGKVA